MTRSDFVAGEEAFLVAALEPEAKAWPCHATIQNDIKICREMEAGCPHPAGFRLQRTSLRGEGTAPPSNRTYDVGYDSLRSFRG
jgi:hypothetical protein